MQLVPADYVTEEDQEIRDLLQTHPAMAYHLAHVINGYRAMLQMCMETMHEEHLDTADMMISCSKKETVLYRLGIPLWETPADWEEAWKHLRQYYKDKDGEEKVMEKTITLSRDYFEHLLNCLANQKFLPEMNTEDLKSVQAENQRIIDEAWNTGMRLLSLSRRDGEERK